MRQVKITAKWESRHTIEVEDDWPKIDTLNDVLEIEDINANDATLLDWNIDDPKEDKPWVGGGPKD